MPPFVISSNGKSDWGGNEENAHRVSSSSRDSAGILWKYYLIGFAIGGFSGGVVLAVVTTMLITG